MATMTRMRLISLLASATFFLAGNTGPTAHASRLSDASHGYGQNPPSLRVCLAHPQLKKCRLLANGSGGADAAISYAKALARLAQACVPSSSAQCKALATAAARAAVDAARVARRAGLPFPANLVPSTGGGGTAPVAGTAVQINGVSGFVYGNPPGSTGTPAALPATGGAAGKPCLTIVLEVARPRVWKL